MKFHALSGMKDYLGKTAEELETIYENARAEFRTQGFREIMTPIMEDGRLFDRSLGSDTDVVSKEMYTVEQGDDRIVALRPENTAGVVRSVVENDLMANRNQLKIYYMGPMFRHEKPQGGRLRQFHQVGLEVFGRDDSLCDAEIISLAQQFLSQCEITKTELLLNSIGCPECRPGYLEKLVNAVLQEKNNLCIDCQNRLEENPLRILDCKEDKCQAVYEKLAPSILDYLCEGCDQHFSEVCHYLDRMGIEYTVDPNLVRGLDYYCRTTFEFVSTDLGSQDAVLAGGRYDGLVEELGGDQTPAIGFASGVERMMILRGTYDERDVEVQSDIYLLPFDSDSLDELIPLAQHLRTHDHPENDRRISVEVGEHGRSLRSQMRRANRYSSSVVVLLGSNEIEDGIVTVKRMDTGDQETVDYPPVDSVTDKIIELLTEIKPENLELETTKTAG